MNIGRRMFLLGRRPPAAAPGILPSCLPERGVSCRSCEEHCETGAIRFAPRLGQPARPIIDVSLCTACGECATACPVRAIVVAEVVPEGARA
ncbi:MAG: 4Fe-4S binding protein [Azoarcus sp.]|nr:4Fe-4S binding protein [Azoarcus sp.]